MTTHSSATAHLESPHVTETTSTTSISDALKRRAQAIINDRLIDAESRALIRYGLEVNDPHLAEIVHRAEAGESLTKELDFSETPETKDNDSTGERVEALAEIICRSGDSAEFKWAAVFVLMETLEKSRDPKRIANWTKHVAFSRCKELNLYEMINAQIAAVESEISTYDALTL